ncbi:MAG: hypothetical protein M0R17_07320 [Candidatus Omnitrophica bacterium]|nr:hypothetical protein [Candidatus Omnitrophota bacterium]
MRNLKKSVERRWKKNKYNVFEFLILKEQELKYDDQKFLTVPKSLKEDYVVGEKDGNK